MRYLPVTLGVSLTHPDVVSHRPHRTVQSVDAKREKAEERERKEKEAEEKKKTEIQIDELWKPFGSSLGWFVAAAKESVQLSFIASIGMSLAHLCPDSTSGLYSISDIREIFSKYITDKQLVNVNDSKYINVLEDEPLANAVWIRNEDTPEFMKRDDALRKIRENMQRWYELKTEGSDPIRKYVVSCAMDRNPRFNVGISVSPGKGRSSQFQCR